MSDKEHCARWRPNRRRIGAELASFQNKRSVVRFSPMPLGGAREAERARGLAGLYPFGGAATEPFR